MDDHVTIELHGDHPIVESGEGYRIRVTSIQVNQSYWGRPGTHHPFDVWFSGPKLTKDGSEYRNGHGGSVSAAEVPALYAQHAALIWGTVAERYNRVAMRWTELAAIAEGNARAVSVPELVPN